MTRRSWIPLTVLALAIGAPVTTAGAQGRGKDYGTEKAEQGKARGTDQKAEQEKARGSGKTDQATPVAPERGRSADRMKSATARTALPASANASPRASVAASPNRGRAVSRFARDLRVDDVRPGVRRFVTSRRAAEWLTGGAVAYAFARGAPDNALIITPAGRDVSIRNRKGDLLVALDDDRARNLGGWRVAPLSGGVRDGAPSFCRSGEGHPVWGRQWCVDKGFGLGTQQDRHWGTTRNPEDLVFGRQATQGTLARDALLSLLGPVAFNRLALHALSLGYTDPLSGAWFSEETGPNVLRVSSGSWPVAELVDTNRDRRADLMLVALRPW
ncbi:MAG: hypothetical protein ABIS15_03565 [Gemmatimonadaceae bacterium]